VDLAIEQTEALIAKQQRIKTGLMQDLLTRGIDKHGNLRSEQTHPFKDSPLGKIPVQWTVGALGEIAEIIDPNPSHRYPPPCDSGVPIASTENFEDDSDFDLTGCDNVPASVFEAQLKRCKYDPTDVVFARKGRLGFARPYGHTEKAFSHTVIIAKAKNTSRDSNEFLLWAMRDRDFFLQIHKRMNSNSGVPTLGVQFLAAIPIRRPEPDEQRRIARVLSHYETLIDMERKSLRKLRSLKTALMQDLLTGRKRVTPLLQPESKPEKICAEA
jgi:type I restriction enzyme S subunit